MVISGLCKSEKIDCAFGDEDIRHAIKGRQRLIGQVERRGRRLRAIIHTGAARRAPAICLMRATPGRPRQLGAPPLAHTHINLLSQDCHRFNEKRDLS